MLRHLLIVGAMSFVSACENFKLPEPPTKRVDVEVDPGVFVPVDKTDWTVDADRREATRLKIHIEGAVVEWKGSEIPIVLRRKDKVLYMVGCDRESQRAAGDDKTRFSYFRQKDGTLVQTAREHFPKELATQNMWVGDKNEIDAIVRLDTSSPLFQMSLNAMLWEHLMTGDVSDVTVDKKLLDEFAAQHRPVKLRSITMPSTK